MKYLLKLANGEGNGYFEEVTKHTFDNHKFALADDGVSPRYEFDDWVRVNEDGTLSIQLCEASPRDLSILVRGLSLPAAPIAVGGAGFLREQPAFIKFFKGRTTSMLETKTGKVYNITERKAA